MAISTECAVCGKDLTKTFTVNYNSSFCDECWEKIINRQDEEDDDEVAE